MDTEFRTVRRISKCDYCPNQLAAGEVSIVGTTRWRVGERTYSRIKRWHPGCFITQGVTKLEREVLPARAGRRRLELTTEQRTERLSLLRQHAQEMFAYRKYNGRGNLLVAVRHLARAVALQERLDGQLPTAQTIRQPMAN